MVGEKCGERLGPHQLDDEPEGEGDDEDPGAHLCGVHGGGAHDGPAAVAVGVTAPVAVLVGVPVVAVAVGALAELVDVRVPVPGAPRGAQEGVHGKPRHDAHHDLDRHDGEHPARRLLVRQEHRHHLVRGREDHGDERAHRDHAPGVERRRHGREPALGQGAQKRPHDRPGLARALDDGLDPIGG